MNNCKVQDLAVFVPPAEPHLHGVFVTVLRDDPMLSAFVGEQIWVCRVLGAPVPCAISGLPIRMGIAFDKCLRPIRAQPQRETLHLPERVPDRAVA